MQAVNLLNMKTLSERLAFAIQQSGISQSELARRVGVTRGAVSLWLKTPDGEITATNNSKAAAALNVDANWLATGRGSHKGKNGSSEHTVHAEKSNWLFPAIPEAQVRALPTKDLEQLQFAMIVALSLISREPARKLSWIEQVSAMSGAVDSKDFFGTPTKKNVPEES